MRKLLILGAGQYGKVAYEIAEAMGQFEEISFLDDQNPAALDKLDTYAAFRSEYNSAVVAMGDAALRLELLEKLEQCGYQIPTLIHPAAYVSPSAIIGKGSFICRAYGNSAYRRCDWCRLHHLCRHDRQS